MGPAKIAMIPSTNTFGRNIRYDSSTLRTGDDSGGRSDTRTIRIGRAVHFGYTRGERLSGLHDILELPFADCRFAFGDSSLHVHHECPRDTRDRRSLLDTGHWPCQPRSE